SRNEKRLKRAVKPRQTTTQRIRGFAFIFQDVGSLRVGSRPRCGAPESTVEQCCVRKSGSFSNSPLSNAAVQLHAKSRPRSGNWSRHSAPANSPARSRELSCDRQDDKAALSDRRNRAR